MRIIDPGHRYALARLDGNGEEVLTFVKREGKDYPGNIGCYEGTNLQDVLRACIDRLIYLDNQITDPANKRSVWYLREIIKELERRAAKRHGRSIPHFMEDVEHMQTCIFCGHIDCNRDCLDGDDDTIGFVE